MSKNTKKMSETATVKYPTVAELAAKRSSAPTFAKTGKSDPNRDDGVLPIEKGLRTQVVIAAAAVQPRHKAPLTPMLVLSLQLEDGQVTTAGLDLPLEESEGIAFGMSEGEEVKYTTRAGQKLLNLCRAVSHDEFSVHAEINKDDPKGWVYYDSEGNVLGQAERNAKAEQINRAVMALSAAVREGDVSFFVGREIDLERAPNENNAKYPYNNFYPSSK